MYAARAARMVGAWPTNDGLVMTYVAAPAERVPRLPRRPRGQPCCAALDLAGDLGERVRAGERAERVYGTADTAEPLPRARTARAGRWSATPGS